jgi:hypothetical protein
MPDAAVEEQGTCQRSMPTMRSKLSIFKGSGNPPAWSPICATAQRTGHPPCRIGRHIPRKVHSSARFLELHSALCRLHSVQCTFASPGRRRPDLRALRGGQCANAPSHGRVLARRKDETRISGGMRDRDLHALQQSGGTVAPQLALPWCLHDGPRQRGDETMWQPSERYPDPAVRVSIRRSASRVALASVERLFTGCRCPKARCSAMGATSRGATSRTTGSLTW